jgi:hypothetical protein
MGINYNPTVPVQWTQLRPFQPIIGTEMGSCQSDRDVLAYNSSAGYVGADFNAWCTPLNGQAVAQGPYYMGDFYWVGVLCRE